MDGNVVTFTGTGDYTGDMKLTYMSTTNNDIGAETFTNTAAYSDDNGNTGSADASIDRAAPTEESPGTEEPGTGTEETPGTNEPSTGTDEPGTGSETPSTDKPDTESPNTDQSGNEPDNEEADEEVPGTDSSNGNGSGETPVTDNGSEETPVTGNQPVTDNDPEVSTNENNSSTEDTNSSNPVNENGNNSGTVLANATEDEATNADSEAPLADDFGTATDNGSGTIIPETSLLPSNNTESKLTNKLPQTGQKANNLLTLVGVILLIMAIAGTIVIRRRIN